MGEPAVPASGGERRKTMGERVMFEPGSVVLVKLPEEDTPRPVLVTGIIDDLRLVKCESLGILRSKLAFNADAHAEKSKVLAPSPKPRQRWENNGDGDVQIVDADGALVVEEWYDGVSLCRGSVVDIARWLAEHGYRCASDGSHMVRNADWRVVGRADAPLMPIGVGTWPPPASRANLAEGVHPTAEAVKYVHQTETAFLKAWTVPHPHSTITYTYNGRSWHICGVGQPHSNIQAMGSLASAVAEIFTAPTREASRRYVNMAVKALGYEPFAKAVQATLISLVGDRISVFPTPNEIMATIDACHAWEHARGQIAPGKRALNRAESKELTNVAMIAAWARTPLRDACDIGEIVAETYERARASC